MPFESNTETGRIFVMRGSRRVLVKVVLFQFFGPGLAQDGATSNFLPDSKSSLLGLSNEVLFVFEFLEKIAKNSQNVLLKTPWMVIYVHQCSISINWENL